MNGEETNYRRIVRVSSKKKRNISNNYQHMDNNINPEIAEEEYINIYAQKRKESLKDEIFDFSAKVIK